MWLGDLCRDVPARDAGASVRNPVMRPQLPAGHAPASTGIPLTVTSGGAGDGAAFAPPGPGFLAGAEPDMASVRL